MDTQRLQKMALQASGEYLMNHLDDVMEMVQDRRAMDHGGVLTEATLVPIEAQIKAIAEKLIQQAKAST